MLTDTMPPRVDSEHGDAVPHWRDEVVAAVEAWLDSESGGGRRARWSRIGLARREKPGWLAVDGRGATVNPDELDSLQVAGPDGPERGRAYGVIEAVQEGDVLRVRIAAHVSSEALHLWATRQPRGFLIESLRDGLRSLTDPGMADALANGRLTALPDIPPERDLPGLNPEQRQVYAACSVPGLHLVWGPPGTGKTMVLQRAITDLLKAGKRILLVSGTNIAVDNALEGVASNRRHRAGELVRVGTPHLPAVANDPTVSLPKLVAARHQAIEAERAEVERSLLALQAKAARLEEIEHRLAGFDVASYQAASRVLEAQARIGTLQQRAEDLTEDLQRARAERSSAVANLEQAGTNWVAITAARQHLEEAAELRRQLDGMEGEVGRIEAEILKLDGRRRSITEQLNAAASISLVQRLRHSKERRRLRHEEEAVRQETGHLFDRYRSAKATAEHQRSLLEPRVADHRRRAAPVDEAEVQRRQAELETARGALMTAGTRVQAAEDALGRVQSDLQMMGLGPELTASQRELLAEAERARWPQLHQELERLRRTVPDDQHQRTRLEQRHEELLLRLERLRRGAEEAIIREASLVATTLARFRLHRAVFEGPYDVVLVDEVGATTLPEVLLAVAKAGNVAVLLGDFLQLGAVHPESFGDRPSQAIERWLLRDCFGACGITTAKQAIQHPGCAVLRTEYRFGQNVMDLANLGFYDQTLLSGVERLNSPDDPEIVLLDTSSLEDLGRVRRSGKIKGWWPAGSLLARVLAQHHQDLGATVGIVTPYGLQVEATLGALRDVEGNEGVIADVGTTHRFQGREFDVVVFDMVEDGGRGWISQAHLSGKGWVRDGARLFNVGVTRTKHRLYLICSLKAIRRAARGSVLVPVRELIARHQIDVVDAAELLTPVGAEPPAPSSMIAHELAATLPKYVRVVDIHDEHSFFPAMERYLERAQGSVWIWAPWTTNRLGEILPLLHDAVRWGVSVTAFVRTDRDSLMRLPPSEAWLEQLRATLPRVVQYHKMHQKIMVIDEHLTLLGSLNIFSHRDSREVMAVLEGQAFARKLLEKEHAQEFADPPKCGRCGGDGVDLYRSESARVSFPWLWRCTKARCGWKGEALSTMRSRRT